MTKNNAGHGCCSEKKLRKGLWSPEEDERFASHIARFGVSCWSSIPDLAGLQRCGKSCRLRWMNYLHPDLKRSRFSQREEDLITALHDALGNSWSQIAARLPWRSDNEIKNFWNAPLRKKLRQKDTSTTADRRRPSGEADQKPAAELSGFPLSSAILAAGNDGGRTSMNAGDAVHCADHEASAKSDGAVLADANRQINAAADTAVTPATTGGSTEEIWDHGNEGFLAPMTG